MLDYYHVEHPIVFELAKDQSAFQNVIHNLTGDSTVFNQSSAAVMDADERDKQIANLELRIAKLEENDLFNKNLIDHQKSIIEQLISRK